MRSLERVFPARRSYSVVIAALLLGAACGSTGSDDPERESQTASPLLGRAPLPIGPILPPITFDPPEAPPLLPSPLVLATRYGTWKQSGTQIVAAVADGGTAAEAQIEGVLGTDFTYSSAVTLAPGGEGHLQFRISGEGRYGVGIRAGGLHLYKFIRQGRAAAAGADPSGHFPADDQIFHELSTVTTAVRAGVPHIVSVTAAGRHFTVALDGATAIDFTEVVDPAREETAPLDVGELGLYALAGATSAPAATFDQVQATTSALSPTNFALLFSTGGYDSARGATRRALVRSINPIAGTSGLDLARSGFVVTRADGAAVLRGSLTQLDRSLGMDLWEVDMAGLTTPGNYVLTVSLAGAGFSQTLTSEPFEVLGGAFTRRMLAPMTFQNAEARSEAVDDFSRWSASGTVPFTPLTSGEILVRGADDGNGATLERSVDVGNRDVTASTFGFAGQITIDSGCDAQLQFLVNGANRYAATLQAGAGGNCAHGGGPGAIRLHEEGPSAPGGFRILASQYLPAALVAGRSYDVRVRVGGGTMDVYVDDDLLLANVALDPNMPQSGTFGIKAWGASARFDHVQAWHDEIAILHGGPGVFTPAYAGRTCSSIFEQTSDAPLAALPDGAVADCTPIFIQRHGYNDCNNYIGEADSHGAFLSGLMDVWTKRSGSLADPDRERLRRSILTAYVYLAGLAKQGSESTLGRLAHEEFGRGGIDGNGGPYQTFLGVYGLGAFAARGTGVSSALAHDACVTVGQSVTWLAQLPAGAWPDEAKAITYLDLEQCSRREGLLDSTALANLAAKSKSAVESLLGTLGANAGLGITATPRDTGRMIPWFEGAYALRAAHPDLWTPSDDAAVKNIARTIEARLDRGNGFRIIPQASGAVDPVASWTQMAGVPAADRQPDTKQNPRLDWYDSTHFATTAADAVLLAELTGDQALEPLATGSLEWILGLNPGVPATRVTSRQGARGLAPSGGAVWRSAAFVENFDAAFARGFEAFRTPDTQMKTWSWAWEPPVTSAHREAWLFDPQNTGFMSIVNGHVLRDGQWDYWNQGINGWASGETFLLFDGVFAKASLLYEEWLDSAAATPLDTTRTNFFDTTTLDRGATASSFQDINLAGFAQAARVATEFCTTKKFGGGAYTGHQIGELEGVLCFPDSSVAFDVSDASVASTDWPIADLEAAPWGLASRAADVECKRAGFAGGLFTGSQTAPHGTRRVACLPSSAVAILTASVADLSANGVTGDVTTYPWATAARAATNVCTAKGNRGGFFTGYEGADRSATLVCLR